jgi:IS5 family transposase
MQERMNAEVMKLRRSTVEHPFATIKYRIFGHPRLLMRGLSGAKTEIGLATMAYNLKRITNQTDGSTSPRLTDCNFMTHDPNFCKC